LRLCLRLLPQRLLLPQYRHHHLPQHHLQLLSQFR
jgi:hypothetical protein